MSSLTRHGCRGFFLLVAALLAMTLAGCSTGKRVAEGRTMPKGRILQNGLPIKASVGNLPPGDPGLKITFIRIGSTDAGEEIDAQITDPAAGSFELIGADGKGIPPGKYRVAVRLAPEGGTDQLKGAYSRERSKIEVEIKEGEDLVIDLEKYRGSPTK